VQYLDECTTFLHQFLPTAIFEVGDIVLTGRLQLLAKEFRVIDETSPLWLCCSSLLDIALCFDHSDETYSWNGWSKQQIGNFLQSLPSRSSIVVGVWETLCEKEGNTEREKLVIGLVCEVINGEVHSVRTFDALSADGLKPSDQLEPGIDDAQEIIRHTERAVAPVAWALFMEKSTWDEWLFASVDESAVLEKAQQLMELAHQGRCVLMRSKAKYN
jgi:hypothetical protein